MRAEAIFARLFDKNFGEKAERRVWVRKYEATIYFSEARLKDSSAVRAPGWPG